MYNSFGPLTTPCIDTVSTSHLIFKHVLLQAFHPLSSSSLDYPVQLELAQRVFIHPLALLLQQCPLFGELHLGPTLKVGLQLLSGKSVVGDAQSILNVSHVESNCWIVKHVLTSLHLAHIPPPSPSVGRHAEPDFAPRWRQWRRHKRRTT